MTGLKALRARWREGRGRDLAAEAVARLRAGGDLEDVGLERVDGRIDLRGLALPQPRIAGRREVGDHFVEELADQFAVTGGTWSGLDLSGAILDDAHLTGVRIRDCRFDGASLKTTRLWACEVEDTSFEKAGFRDAGLGGWSPQGPNVFRGVSFASADLRAIGCAWAVFERCDFGGAKLRDVDFEASSFTGCRFAGELRNVIFNRTGLIDTGGGQLRELDLGNQMDGCDFAEAELRFVAFRRLALRTIVPPAGADHIVVHDYPCVAKRLARALADEESRAALGLLGVIEHDLEWMSPDRDLGIFHRADWPKEADYVEQTLRAAEAECAKRPRGGMRRLLRRA